MSAFRYCKITNTSSVTSHLLVLTFHPNDENVFICFSVLVVRLAFHRNDENAFIHFSVYFLKGSEFSRSERSEFSRSEFSRFGGVWVL